MMGPRRMAELSVLGACLIDRDSPPLVVPMLAAYEFERQQHRRIFRAVLALHEAGCVIDVITVCEQMKRTGELEDNDLEHLAEILDAVPTAVNVVAHAAILRDYGG